MVRQFAGSAALTLLGLVLAAAYGWIDGHSVEAALGVVWIVVVLAVLEVSLSFDNAVVNASVLQGMDAVWRRRFLTWGMLFAVFGTRVLFPLAIVGFTAGIGPVDALRLSLTDPVAYEATVSHAHYAIAGFGGAFLLLVGLEFFLDTGKDVHWIKGVETTLSRFADVEALGIGLALVLLVLVAAGLPGPAALSFLTAGALGIVGHIAVQGLGRFFERREEQRALAGLVVRSGLGGFLYLNVLDASFSLDGVIGAFALSNNMVVIAIGLSIGALFVRSLTVMLVERGTLSEYRFLEHGAFWAIVALGVIMLVSARIDIPETVTGLIGAVLIALSWAWSVRYRRRAGSEQEAG
ncbi:MAG: DUF475 domain-containing protein [Sphingomonadales bacterium]|nr:DUF475 domain-containing protein [Sphingomonadales bacterium]